MWLLSLVLLSVASCNVHGPPADVTDHALRDEETLKLFAHFRQKHALTRLENFYKHDSAKLAKTKVALSHFRGREDILVAKIEKKYKTSVRTDG